MLPPGGTNGYNYPPVPTNPTGAPSTAFAVPPRGRMGYGAPGNDAPVPATLPGDPYANNYQNEAKGPGDTVSNFIPDPMQQFQMPIHTMFPDAEEAPQEFYLGVHGTGRDTIQRHSVESQTAVAWDVPAPSGGTAERWAHNPRRNAYPEGGNVAGFTDSTPATERTTDRNSPNSYSFTRPFDQQFERRFDGRHFSMADHRRNYPIMGMKPPPTWRNTSRVDPAPWDANIVDTPGGPSFLPGLQVPQYEAPMNSQAFVFGG